MIYGIVDSTTNKRWAIFDDSKKESILAYFKTLKKHEDFSVVTFLGGKEIVRCNLLEF